MGAPRMLSANQAEPLNSPPVTNPLARRLRMGGRAIPVNCHPPGTRCPAPRLVQSTPLVEVSKVASQASGLVPPRSQVMLELSEVRLCVARSEEHTSELQSLRHLVC